MIVVCCALFAVLGCPVVHAQGLAADSTLSVLADSTLIAAPVAPARDLLAEARDGFTPENRAYQGIRVWLRIVGPVYGVLVSLLLLFTGLSARFRDIAHAMGSRGYVRVLVYFSLYSVTVALFSLPLAWYEEYALEHQFALSNQSLADWAFDSVKGITFSIVVMGVVPLLWLAWRVIESRPRSWWLWLSLGTLPIAVAGTLLQPLLFDPLFNRFTPLRDASLRQEILDLGARAGIPGRNVYEVDMSTKTNKVNAYVNGFGASQRIVLWDTTLERLQRDEILFVMGHEMGHYVLKHIWKGLMWVGVGAFLAFGLTAWIVHLMLTRFGERWGVRGVGDLAALPLIVAALTVIGFASQPVSNALTRQVEHESDVYALELTRDNGAGARAFLKLAQNNRSDPAPAPWVRTLFYTHPPLSERIAFALSYKPWLEGRPNQLYVDRKGEPVTR